MAETDPILEQTRGLLSAQSAADAAQRAQAVQRALIRYGAVPDFGSFDSPFLSADITDTARGLAAQNTQAGLSTLAQLTKAHQDALKDIPSQLAARGLLRSGALAYQLNEENLRNRVAINNETQQMIDYFSGAYGAFAQAERDRAMALLQAQNESQMRAQEKAYRERDFQLAQQGLQLQRQSLQQQAAQAAQSFALQQQQMAQSAAQDAAAMAFQQQQLAASQAAPAFDPLAALYGGGGGGGTITAQEAAVMREWGPRQSTARPDWVKAIFQAHPGFLSGATPYQIVG